MQSRNSLPFNLSRPMQEAHSIGVPLCKIQVFFTLEFLKAKEHKSCKHSKFFRQKSGICSSLRQRNYRAREILTVSGIFVHRSEPPNESTNFAMKKYLKPRKRISNARRRGHLDFGALEPRQLLATLVGDYVDDFHEGSPDSNWTYQWNAPTGWSPQSGSSGSPGLPNTGNIDAPGINFRNLVFNEGLQAWTTDGDGTATNSPPGQHLKLGQASAHAGVGVYPANSYARYAIARFDIPEAGFYSISDSILKVNPSTNGQSDGVEYKIFVDKGHMLSEGAVAPGQSAGFDRHLGYLEADDFVYVAFGPGENFFSDSFQTDFSILKHDGGAVTADFVDDFHTGNSESPWRYQWNRSDSGAMVTVGSTEDINGPGTKFKDLIYNAAIDSWTTDGDSVMTNGAPGEWLHFKRGGGGHAGRGINATNSVERYAVATYEVQEEGYYKIIDSYLDLLSSASKDGVEFRVFVNNDAPVETGTVLAGNVAYFDTELGFLKKGDLVRVAFGPETHFFDDAFTADFSIYKHAEQTVANYNADRSSSSPGTMPPGWEYLWNSPSSPSAFDSGAIGDPSHYELLQWGTHTHGNENRSYWSPDGAAFSSSFPARYLRLEDNQGHPGATYNTDLGNKDRYVIAAYTVENSGRYAIEDSILSTSSSLPSHDGVNLVVHVNNQTPLVDGNDLIAEFNSVALDNGAINFDMDLGYLSKGDTVYVAFGGVDNDTADKFTTDFSITRMLPRNAPDLSLTTRDFTQAEIENVAKGSDAGEIWDQIRDAVTRTKTNLGQSSAYAQVLIEPGTYRLSSEDLSPFGQAFFTINGAKNLYIKGEVDAGTGEGVTFLVNNANDYNKSLFLIQNSSNVVFEGITIDYAEEKTVNNETQFVPTTFSQGVIKEVNSNSIVLEVDTNKFRELDSTFLGNNSSGTRIDGANPFGYVIDANTPGKLKDGTRYHYTANDIEPSTDGSSSPNDPLKTYTITFPGGAGDLQSQMTVGDTFVMQRRINNADLFRFSQNSQDVTIRNVVAYSAPNTFVNSIFASGVNVIDSKVMIRPETDRMKSINADAVHLQSNRESGWVEDSFFEGGGDDITNFYSFPATINSVDESERVFNIGFFNSRKNPTNATKYINKIEPRPANAFQVGDKLTFMEPGSGIPIKDVKIISVVHDSNNHTWTVTVDQPVPEIQPNVADGNWRLSTTVYNNDLSQGFLIQDSQFTNTRRYGNFVMSNDGHIVDNFYDGLSDQAIAGHNENDWPFGLYADNILVQGNEFHDIGFSHQYQKDNYQTGVVGFFMDRSGDQLVDERDFQFTNLQIRDNVFYEWHKTAISVRNAQHVTIANNTILAGEEGSLSEPGNESRDTVFEIAYTDDVLLIDNAIADNFKSRLLFSNSTNLTESGNFLIQSDALRVWQKLDEAHPDVTLNGDATYDFNPTQPFDKTTRHNAGRFDNSVHLSGNGSVTLNDGAVSAQGGRTISLWFRPEQSVTGTQVLYEEGNEQRGLNIYLKDESVFVGGWNATHSGFVSNEQLLSGWNHVSLRLSAGTITGFLNGIEFGSTDVTGLAAFGGDITLGNVGADGTKLENGYNSNASYGFQGSLDELRVYDTSLDNKQIGALALSKYWDIQSEESDSTSSGGGAMGA